MTKMEMVNKILEDMYIKSGDNRKAIDKRFKAYLTRQNKTDLESIYNARFN